MRTWMVVALLAALPAAAEAAVFSGRVVSVDPEFNTMVLAQYDALGDMQRWELAWDDDSAADPVLDNAPVGFEVTVAAERNYFGTWDVFNVLRAPAAPAQVVVQVVGVNRETGQVEIRDPVLAERRVVVMESYRVDGLRPGGYLTMDAPPRVP